MSGFLAASCFSTVMARKLRQIIPVIWSPECLASKADNVSIDEIRPTFCDTLSEKVLGEMVQLVEDTTKHNFMSALLVIGGTIMSCHYRQIIDTFGGFPIVIACGPTETGKSTSLRLGLSLTGGQKRAFYSKGKNAYFLERSALSCLPYGIDDPNMSSYTGRKQLDVGELVVDLYNGAKTANLRSGALLPHSAPLIATNNPPKNDPRLDQYIYTHYYCDIHCILLCLLKLLWIVQTFILWI